MAYRIWLLYRTSLRDRCFRSTHLIQVVFRKRAYASDWVTWMRRFVRDLDGIDQE